MERHPELVSEIGSLHFSGEGTSTLDPESYPTSQS